MMTSTVMEAILPEPAPGPPPGPPPGVHPLPGQLDRWLASRGGELVALRRQLHAHPELSHQEFETAGLVARELAVAGLQPQLLPKGNGVLCDVGEGDRVVAFRADLDALPLQDVKDVAYRSTVPGVAHACGHDVHAAILLGVGLALAHLAERDELPGRVRLLFQPAAEAMAAGALDVISAGGLKDVTAIFGLHCAPRLPTGIVGVRSGPSTAAVDTVEVTLTGPGGHTARPHQTVDLVHALGRLVVDVPALLDRRVDPRAGISVVFGAIRAGEATNAIPAVGSARATVRVLSREAWQEAPDLITQLVHDAVAGTGAHAEVAYTRGVPPVINDSGATSVIARAAARALGAGRVLGTEVSMNGDGFACYLEQVPGATVWLGTGPADPAQAPDLHQPDFDVAEQAIEIGARVLTHTALAGLAADVS